MLKRILFNSLTFLFKIRFRKKDYARAKHTYVYIYRYLNIYISIYKHMYMYSTYKSLTIPTLCYRKAIMGTHIKSKKF